jgi:hypothetical protein
MKSPRSIDNLMASSDSESHNYWPVLAVYFFEILPLYITTLYFANREKDDPCQTGTQTLSDAILVNSSCVLGVYTLLVIPLSMSSCPRPIWRAFLSCGSFLAFFGTNVMVAYALFNGAMACATANRTLFACGLAQWSYFLVFFTRTASTQIPYYLKYTAGAKYFRLA